MSKLILTSRQAAMEIVKGYGADVLTGTAPGISLADMIEAAIDDAVANERAAHEATKRERDEARMAHEIAATAGAANIALLTVERDLLQTAVNMKCEQIKELRAAVEAARRFFQTGDHLRTEGAGRELRDALVALAVPGAHTCACGRSFTTENGLGSHWAWMRRKGTRAGHRRTP
jgi:hypothetical protein